MINWRCSKAGCLFIASAWEGHLNLGAQEHNYAADPEDFEAKQARAKLREGVEETVGSVADVVHQVVGETPVNFNIEALKKAAR